MKMAVKSNEIIETPTKTTLLLHFVSWFGWLGAVAAADYDAIAVFHGSAAFQVRVFTGMCWSRHVTKDDGGHDDAIFEIPLHVYLRKLMF